METQLSINEIATLTELPVRTVRFYVQEGLVDRPIGERKGARYNQKHVDQLLAIKKWQAAGLSLERIKGLLIEPDASEIPPRPRWPGMVEVWSHLHVSDGVEMQIEPGRAGLTPEELREFLRKVMDAYATVKQRSEK